MELQFNSPEDYDKLVIELQENLYALPEDYLQYLQKKLKTKDLNKILEETGLEYDEEIKRLVKKIEYETVTIPVGTNIHRADHQGATLPSTELPAFFGNSQTINIYARGNPDAFSHYEFTKEANLINLSYETLHKLMINPYLDGEEIEILNLYFDMENGYVKPTNFRQIDKLKMIQAQKSKQPIPRIKYLNRLVAEIVCKLGFDGWIVLPYSQEKRQGMFQYSVLQKQEMPYPPEIMLCKWDDFLEPIGSNKKTSNSHTISNILPKSELNGSSGATEGGRKHKTHRKKKSKSTHKKRK
jgi:hypothetical protein